MKVGQTVNYYDPSSGERHDAKIVNIEGVGDSLAKVLTLQVGDDKRESVFHGGDQEEGDSFWLVKGEESAPSGWADKSKSKSKKKG